MSEWATIAIAILSSGAFTAIVNFILNAIHNRKSKKTGVAARLESVEQELKEIKAEQRSSREELEKISEHNDLQYLSLLRLTVMDSDMPMGERLIAGKEYIRRGGNGDVKAYYKALEESINTADAE